MPAFNRISGKFAYKGMNVHNPVDLMPPDRCPILFNLQPDLVNDGLSLRPAIYAVATTAAAQPIHSICRMNDSAPEATKAFSRFVGAASSLYGGQVSNGGPLTALDTGYSGNPLAMVPYRPSQCPEPWLYVFDSARQQRFKTDNATKQNIGIASPTAGPGLAVIQPLYDTVDNATASWSAGTPSGGAISAPSTVARVPASTTIGAILFDSGSTGMACIQPSNSGTNYSWATQGSMVVLGSGGSLETVVIEQVFPGNYSTTVAAIQYDSGSTGLCTIVPTLPLPGLARNMLLRLNSAVYVRVLSVTAGPDGSYSFRCNTGGTTITATQTIVGNASFRAWCTVTHAASAAITGNSINFTYTPTIAAGSMSCVVFATPGNGSLSYVGGRPLQNEDYMHLSIAFDNPQYVTEVHLLLDVDTTTNDFNHNYYYYVLRQGDFNQSVQGGATTLQDQLSAITSAVSQQLVSDEALGINTVPAQPNYPTPQTPTSSAPGTSQLDLGSLAWLEAMFHLSDLTRVGSDASRTLANVANIGVIVYTSGGTVNLYFGGWWAGGGYGPDCNFNSYGNQNPPIQWRYRYRNSSTGAHSTVSPETRNGEILRRQGINVTATASSDAQVDFIDWERRGGSIPDWHYIGSKPVVSGYTFLDNITENAVQIGDPLEVTSYQPWPVTDVPHFGTALVTGTSVLLQSGDDFNIQWLRGTEIIIGGNTYSLYAPPASTAFLQLAQSVVPPSATYAFSIPEATLESQPLYGAWLDEANNRICAVGDPLNPGLMYFSNVDNPDGASDSGYIEITSPSEPLLNGFYAEGSNYVFTSSSLYRVESTNGAPNPYASYRLSGVEGLAGPWAFDCQRRLLFYWGPDGIYVYSFGPAGDNLTSVDLYPLFPHAGQQSISGVPISIHGVAIYPPDYALTTNMRIAYGESFVYATYINTNNQVEALVYSLAAKGWRKDGYSPSVTLFVLEKGIDNPALLAGGSDGNLYQISSTSKVDAGGPITWDVITPCKDAGDTRANKQWGDWMLDYDTGDNVNEPGLLVVWDNLLIDGPNPAVPLTATRAQQIFNLITPPDTNDTPVIHRNMAIAVAGTGPITLFEWQPSFVPLPEDTTARVTDWRGLGVGTQYHYAFVQGIRIHANTHGQVKQFEIQYDGYLTTGETISINFNGEQTQPISFAKPFKAHMVRLVPLDNVAWEVWPDFEWIAEPEPEPATYWISQPTALGQNGFIHARELWIAYAAGVGGGLVSVVVDNGSPVTIVVLGASGSPVKRYFPCPPLKGKYWQITATGTALQLYERDLEFLVKSWGSTGPYIRVRPFGDASGGGGASGARI